MGLTIAQLAKGIGAELVCDAALGQRQVSAVGTVETSSEDTVTFITDSEHIPKLEKSQAGAVIVSGRIECVSIPQLIVKDVNKALIEVLKIFAPKLKPAVEGIHKTAKVGQDVKIAKGVSVGAWAVIEDGVEIGENSIIGSGCMMGENSKLGKSCRLDSNVVVYHNCTIGDNVIIQANSTIGSTGFGYCFIDGRHLLIPHNGVVVIEDFVGIGANCCIDRAKFGETRIGAGTKIDNLVQIAHNVVIGKCCLIAGLVGIAGSCKIGDGVVLAGQVGLADNIEIADGTKVGAQAGVTRNIKAGQQVVGSPAVDAKEALEAVVLVRRLPKLVEKLKQLSKRVEKLEAAKDHKD